MADPIWFWQRIVSPHMMELAKALAARGVDVTYVAEQPISDERARQGWQAPEPGGVDLRLMPDVEAATRLVEAAPPDSVHICQGLRGNGCVGKVREMLARRGLRQWAIMETIEDRGWRGIAKRLAYRRLVRHWCDRMEGILAIGEQTPAWLVERGMRSDRVFPFAYFLSAPTVDVPVPFEPDRPFRFVYVGRIIELKRIDLLIEALARMDDVAVELAVIGSGPLEDSLRGLAERLLPGRVSWLGRMPQQEVPIHLLGADCLVLPSRYDGWGAVVSEALMAGTPAICSDRCGAANVVRASGQGGVFKAEDVDVLAELVRMTLRRGRQTPGQRAALKEWALCLTARRGADYLGEVLGLPAGVVHKPAPPWTT